MASKAKQQNYRRLMKEAKSKSSAPLKKIDHPLAKYNALEQLSCIVCQQTVKSELLWGTHLKSKRHRENIAELKNNKDVLQQSARREASTVKRPQSQLPPQEMAEMSSGSDGKGSEELPSKKRKVVTIEEREDSEEAAGGKEQKSLPADFFDPGVSKFGAESDSDDEGKGGVGNGMALRPTSTVQTPDTKTKEQATESGRPGKEALPEGFFDDPKLDAKARKVEYRDKMDDEWERFQKTIQKENDVSEAIQVEEDTEAQGDRDLTEVQEQVECFQKAEVLRQKQEALLAGRAPSTSDGGEPSASEDKKGEVERGEDSVDESDSSSCSDLDDLEMDWRAKHS